MKADGMKSFSHCIAAAIFVLLAAQQNFFAAQIGTGFTYQGLMRSGTNPASGSYDLVFGLYDSVVGGTQIGPLLTNSTTIDTNGYFVASLDFGPAAFNGDPRWLEITLYTNGTLLTALYPRQPLTAAPYASYAIHAASAEGATVAYTLSTNLPVPSQAISITNFTFSESINLARAGIAEFGANRFAWTNTLARLSANKTLSICFVGNGWAEDSEFGGFVTNLLSYKPLAGYASTVLFVLPSFMLYGPTSGNDTALSSAGDDTNWHGSYFVLTNVGNITAPAQVIVSDTYNVQYLANPGGGSFVLEIRTNGSAPNIITNLDSTWTTIATVNAQNPTWEGRVAWWTNSVPMTTQLRVRATTPGWTPIVSYAQWNSTITNGVILSQYSRQNSGNYWTYTDTNRVYPIWTARNPDLVFVTGGWGDSRFSDTVGTLNLVKAGFPKSDIVDVGVHLVSTLRSDALEQNFCLASGIPFFDGQGASIAAWGNYANGASLGLYTDGAHLAASGYATFSQLLWSWMGMTSYSSAQRSAPAVTGVTTNVSIGGVTLYITNGIIGRVSTP
jgi:hypothetical protein